MNSLHCFFTPKTEQENDTVTHQDFGDVSENLKALIKAT